MQEKQKRASLVFNRRTFLTKGATAAAVLVARSQTTAADTIGRDGQDVRLHDVGVGVTRHGTRIGALIHRDDLNLATPKRRVLLVGGLDGEASSVATIGSMLRWFYADEAAATLREQFVLSAVPNANPDGVQQGLGGRNRSDGMPERGYPPRGPAYGSPTDPEAAYLWRWIGLHAPNLVVEVRTGKQRVWSIADSGEAWRLVTQALFEPTRLPAHDELVARLPRVAPCEVGTIPALSVWTPPNSGPQLGIALAKLADAGFAAKPSAARVELQSRAKRSPREVVAQLLEHYGKSLERVEYIPALALVGRLRWGELTNDPKPLADVERIVAPYFSGEKETTPTSGSGQSGHLIFVELANCAAAERRARYIELAKIAADQMFDATGTPKPVMPFHTEMSDALFMGGPILAAVGRLTGESRYLDASAAHIRFMQKLVLRGDGLYRHSPLDEAAWGRGNGFPALGLAMVLANFPAEHSQRGELLDTFRRHMESLSRFQDVTGCWHQVIDHDESYREFTCTCMIAWAMSRGVRSGWLPRERFQPIIDRAWSAIRLRIGTNGRLVDVCTGTGKQKSLRDYLDREAILGQDARGGAMALLIATELAASGMS